MATSARSAAQATPRGRIAQLVERGPYKADVGGSSPSAPTKVPFVTSLGEQAKNVQGTESPVS